MQTSVIGFPRVGELRELKFTTEKFFKGLVSEQELEALAKDIRKKQWLKMQEKEVDFIPSNDFSFYDNFLDAAVLFNIIPERYRELSLSPLEKYFAMARGYKGPAGDVKALAMKKWFNTNYHYMVAEISDEDEIRLAGDKPFKEYEEAKALGVETKPVVIGPFTLLKLLRYTEKKTEKDFLPQAVSAYKAYVEKFASLGAKWLAFDEAYLVRDLDKEDLTLFTALYQEILSVKGETKVLLQTYFGDVRDAYESILALPFDGVGLDFLEGKETKNLVSKGFPKDKLLFAGLVNGKNIWRNHYEKTIEQIKDLENKGISVVLGTSCSLLHVPYTLEGENKLSAEIKSHFSFAVEKLSELLDLKRILDGKAGSEVLEENKALFASVRPNSEDKAVKDRCASITDADYTRLPAFSEREKIQIEEFKLPLFPTTTIGSFPQSADVRQNRTAFKKGEKTKEEYVAFNKEKIAEWVKIQEDLDLDVLVHGEFERNDMVEYFGELLSGFLFTEKAWVQSYGTRCVKPPIIWGDVRRLSAMTVEWSTYAQSLTKRPMKGMLTGPVTILNWSFPREDISVKESTKQIALAIRDEVLDLEKNGIKVIQVDEAALREKLPLRKSDWYSEYLDWAIPAFRLVHSGCKAGTQIHTHMCYSEFTDIIPAIDNMDADVISFEASRSDLQILDSLRENHFRTEVGPGVYDIHSPRVPSVEEIKEALGKMLKKIEKEKLWVNPDCGLKTRGREETLASLKNLVQAAKELRNEYC